MSTRRRPSARAATAPRLRSSRAAQRRALVVSVMFCLAGIACLGLGLAGWLMPQTRPTRVVAGIATPVTATAWFDRGATLFVATPQGAAATAQQLVCTVTHGTQVQVRTTLADPSTGLRARDGLSLAPTLEIGRLADGDVLRCNGAGLEGRVAWLLPTTVGVRPVPLALVLAGVGLLGAAAAANPRVRGMVVFGR